MLDTYALKVFLETARTENYTEAARMLHLTQPAVSAHIKTLEDYLQVKLFERDGRNMRLTKVGQSFVPKARQLVQLTIDVEQSMRTAEGKVTGDLIIGRSAPSAEHILLRLGARFQHSYPGVRISIRLVNSETLLEKLAGGEFDLGVTTTQMPDSRYFYSDLFVDKLVLIVPSTHPWAQANPILPTDLLAERFVCHEPDSACRVAVCTALSRVGVDIEQLQVVLEVGNPEALVVGVEQGIGVSFVSLLAAWPGVMAGHLSIIDVDRLDLQVPVYLVQDHTHVSSPVGARFVEFTGLPQNRSLVEMLAEGRRG